MNANYNRAYATNKFDGMSPEQIILALYDGTIAALDKAHGGIEANEPNVAGEGISKAMAIVGELQASLNKEAGGELGERLDALYSYVLRGLLEANMTNDGDKLREMQAHIKEIRDGWAAMVDSMAQQKVSAAQPSSSSTGYV